MTRLSTIPPDTYKKIKADVALALEQRLPLDAELADDAAFWVMKTVIVPLLNRAAEEGDQDQPPASSGKALTGKAQGAEDLKWLRHQIVALCEDTEGRYGEEAQRDLEGKQGAYARGRVSEAKSIRKAICEVVQDRIAARPEAQETRSQAADDVLAERHRQVEVEGWTPKHDDTHSRGEMACAAACYATGSDLWTGHEQADRKGRPTLIGAARVWPWSGWWKPADRRRNLVKAGALILAEIERLDRLPALPSSSGQGGR